MSFQSGIAPWIAAQTTQLLAQRGHAWLLHGPSGLGQYSLSMELVSAWLCERPTPQGACGNCVSCHAIEVRSHADLFVLMPETTLLARGWPLGEKAQAELDDKKRKASKEIRVDAMREAVEFSQRTSALGRGKAVLVFPAERMNNVSANALLKTLEEPAGDVKFVLASEAAHQLLPTIRSRCLGHAMDWPAPDAALHWLASQGVDGTAAPALLRATGGRPDNVLLLANSGRDAAGWARLPRALQRGDVDLLRDWAVGDMLDTLHKLCHDLQVVQQGAKPRFFLAADLPTPASHVALSQWGRDLAQAMKTMEHPFNPGLMQEALLSQAITVLNSGQ